MKRLVSIVTILVLAVSMFTGCSNDSEKKASAEASLETMKPVKLNWAISMGPSHGVIKFLQYFADEVKDRTNGKVEITLYPGDTLVKSADIYDSMVQGIVDMGEGDPAYAIAAFPLTSAYFLPGMKYANSSVATKVIDEFMTSGKYEELTKAKFLFVYGMSPSILFGNKRVEKCEDIEGMQIRATGFAINAVEALGASAVGITPSETYEALMKGTADAALMPAEVLVNWNFAEVVDYVTKVTGLSTSCHYIAMNNDVWNSLPSDVQAIIEQVADETVDKIAPLWDEMGKEGFEFAKEHDTEIIDMSDAELDKCMVKLEPVKKAWLDKYSGKGLDAQGALDYMQSLIDKYNAQAN